MKIFKKFSDLFCKLTNIRIMPVVRKNGSFKISYANFNTNEARSLYIQFSLKDPWLIPHYEEHFGNIDIPLYGWLFFYFGLLTEGLVYLDDAGTGIKDSKGNNYYYVKFDTRKEADTYHELIKSGRRFKVYKNEHDKKIVIADQ